MTDRIPLDDMTSDQLDQLHNDLDRYEEVVDELNTANTGLARDLGRAETDLARYAEAESADAAAGSYALRAEGVEAQLARVASLYERWVKAGAPPLGVSMARWWDVRLAEFQAAIRPPADESARTTVNDVIELEQLRAKVAEFDHIINWHTTCASCARILDSAYAETVRAETAEAAVTRVRNLAGRIRQGAPWTANDDDIAAHILAAVDGDQAPAASCSPGAAETEPNNPAAWTPPPPGDRREQLPDHILALIDVRPYTSTACEAAKLLERQMPHALRRVELGGHADRLHARCRLNNKFTGALCICPCHRRAATLNSAAPNASRVEPDPPVAS